MSEGRGEDPYVVLGVSRGATAEEIRGAYHAQAAKYHPDRHPGNPLADLAGARMAELNRAYELLSDPARRAAFDAGRRTQAHRVADDRATRARYLKGAAVLLIVPLLFRGGAALMRVFAALLRLVIRAVLLRGPRLAAAAGFAAIAVLLFAFARRPRGR
jgi:curved DNA-binding protein CbpA